MLKGWGLSLTYIFEREITFSRRETWIISNMPILFPHLYSLFKIIQQWYILSFLFLSFYLIIKHVDVTLLLIYFFFLINFILDARVCIMHLLSICYVPFVFVEVHKGKSSHWWKTWTQSVIGKGFMGEFKLKYQCFISFLPPGSYLLHLNYEIYCVCILKVWIYVFI